MIFKNKNKNKRHQGFFYETSFSCFTIPKNSKKANYKFSSFPIPKNSKKGQGHIEIILSFVIFVGFVLFLFIIFNPFKAPLNPGLVDSVYGNLQEELGANVISIAVNLEEDYLLMPLGFETKTFFEIDPINGFDCTKENLLVRGKNGETTDSLIVDITGGIFVKLIAPGTGYETYYTLLCSPEFSNTFDPAGLQPIQTQKLDKSADHYALGILTDRDFWSNSSFTGFSSEYYASYGELKDKIVPKGSDFGVSLLDLEGNVIFIIAHDVPRSLDVYAKTVAIEVLDPTGGVNRRKLEIRVW